MMRISSVFFIIIFCIFFNCDNSLKNVKNINFYTINDYINKNGDKEIINREKDDIGFVFIHGAGLGAWIWRDVVSNLKYPYAAIDFPGRGKNSSLTTKNLSLESYVNTILSDIDQFKPNNIVLVVHSMGGIVGLEVNHLRKDRIIGFVALGAVIPSNNGSFISSLPFPNKLIMKILISFTGTWPPVSDIRNGICSDLGEKLKSEVMENFVPESKFLFFEKISNYFPVSNSLYVYLKNDKEFGDIIQRNTIPNLHTNLIIEMESGHLPMLSKPKELADLLNIFAEGIRIN